MHMKKIIVTGAQGFLASRFIREYPSQYDILSLGRTELDIRDADAVMQTLTAFAPDYVVHTAAISDTGVCQNHPDQSYVINVQGAVNIAQACQAIQCKLINCSSDQIYNGNMEPGPYPEDIPVNPNTVYGQHKLAAEQQMSSVHPDTVHLRLTWMYGLYARNLKTNTNIITNTLRHILQGSEYRLPCHEYRGITDVYSVIENLSAILDLPAGVYNTGSENDLSTCDVGRAVLDALQVGDHLRRFLIPDHSRYKDHPRDLRISNGKLRSHGIHFPTTTDGLLNFTQSHNLAF